MRSYSYAPDGITVLPGLIRLVSGGNGFAGPVSVSGALRIAWGLAVAEVAAGGRVSGVVVGRATGVVVGRVAMGRAVVGRAVGVMVAASGRTGGAVVDIVGFTSSLASGVSLASVLVLSNTS